MGKGMRSSKRPLQKVLGQGANVNADNPLEVHDPKVGSLISYEGVTTADGAGAGTTLIDTVLTTKPDYDGNLVIITSGAYAGQARDINGDTTGGTVSPHLAFGGQILRGTTFVIAAIRLTPAEVAALTALVAALMADVGDASAATLGSLLGILGNPATSLAIQIATGIYGDRIFFDDATGIAGTAYPVGTPQVPSDVIADVITMCAARNIHKIDVHGAVTLGAAMQHYCFFGSEHEDITDILDLSGEDVDGSHIEGMIVTGGQGGANFLTLIRCIVNAVTTFNGRMNCCSFWSGTCSFKNAGYIDLVDCESIYGAVTITVQAPTRGSIKNWRGNLVLTAQDGGTCYVRGFKGTLEIDLMTAGTLGVYANGADITINADCTGGTINIYGNARITDNSGGGCTVNDYTLDTDLATVDTVVDAIKVATDKQAGATPVSDTVTANWNTATGTSGESGEDLVTIGANDTKYKLHSLVLDVSALTDAAEIHVKLFMQVNGVEKKVYDQTFTVPTGTTPPDTDGLWIVNGSVGIHEALRVEVYSDTDESKAIAYDYMLEVM